MVDAMPRRGGGGGPELPAPAPHNYAADFAPAVPAAGGWANAYLPAPAAAGGGGTAVHVDARTTINLPPGAGSNPASISRELDRRDRTANRAAAQALLPRAAP
jgi:hypothetical protein